MPKKKPDLDRGRKKEDVLLSHDASTSLNTTKDASPHFDALAEASTTAVGKHGLAMTSHVMGAADAASIVPGRGHAFCAQADGPGARALSTICEIDEVLS